MQSAQSRLSIDAGSDEPSWSKTTMIRSPEQSTTGSPVAAEAATADGNRVANTMAKVAARKASERVRDQCSGEWADTTAL
jgi:hypothetical protein